MIMAGSRVRHRTSGWLGTVVHSWGPGTLVAGTSIRVEIDWPHAVESGIYDTDSWELTDDPPKLGEVIRRKSRQGLPRVEVLEEAKELITGDRNNQYGPPTQDFTRTADGLTALGFQFNGEPLKSHHVAMIMAQLKLSRLAWEPTKRDSWVDLAGYAANGFECVIAEEEA